MLFGLLTGGELSKVSHHRKPVWSADSSRILQNQLRTYLLSVVFPYGLWEMLVESGFLEVGLLLGPVHEGDVCALELASFWS